MRIIVITGGVLSGLGKGVAIASIGFLFSEKYNIVPIKLDGYLNIDPGTMNPIEHGEVFVLDDGSEVDMDFGHYERFLDISIKGEQSLTMGKIFYETWKKERKGDFLGKTVQMIPHVTDIIKEKIINIGKKNNADILLVEVGGTVGDIENQLIIESLRQLKKDYSENILFIHLTYVPIPYGVKEQKTKPTQQSIKLLKQMGINPDLILCRCSEKLTEKTKMKIALFSDLNKEDILSAIDVDNIYKIPILFNDNENIGKKISEKLNLEYHLPKKYFFLKKKLSKKTNKEITITIFGKYTNLEDSYASIVEAIKHCELTFSIKANIIFKEVSSELNLENLKTDGIIIPGGFGSRGIEGKIKVIKYARENNIPFLGICLGLQLAVIEFLRNVCGIKDANSLEINQNTKHPVITILDEQKKITEKGGTMRLGSYDAILLDSKIKRIYEKIGEYRIDKNQNFIISERHRHRYEVNPKYINILEEKGFKVVGKSKTGLVEFIEIPKLDYFVATQSHPELKSRPHKPAPLFYGLFETILNKK